MGCGSTLSLDNAGRVTCTMVSCPKPDLLAQLMGDRLLVDHMVQVTGGHVAGVSHPLREQVMPCCIRAAIDPLVGAPLRDGRYVVREGAHSEWVWADLG